MQAKPVQAKPVLPLMVPRILQHNRDSLGPAPEQQGQRTFQATSDAPSTFLRATCRVKNSISQNQDNQILEIRTVTCAEHCFGRPRSVDNWSASQILLGQAHNHAQCHSKCHISACAGSALALELIWEHSALMQRQGGAVIEAQKAIFKLDIHSTLSH